MDTSHLQRFCRCAGACGGARIALPAACALRKEIRSAQHVDELSDQQWELREAEERMKSLLEAQGDLIVRRDSEGRIAYANDAFCALAGQTARQRLSAINFRLPILEQGPINILVDGTRVHDQKIDTPTGAALDFVARGFGARRHTSRIRRRRASAATSPRARVAERALADARDQADAANLAKSRFLAMVSHEIRTPLERHSRHGGFVARHAVIRGAGELRAMRCTRPARRC